MPSGDPGGNRRRVKSVIFAKFEGSWEPAGTNPATKDGAADADQSHDFRAGEEGGSDTKLFDYGSGWCG